MKSLWLELEKLINHTYACWMGNLAEHQRTKLKQEPIEREGSM